jgi:hypothetical protein
MGIEVPDEDRHFNMDAYAQNHLRQWFELGHAPNDWDLETLAAFEQWVFLNEESIPMMSSWKDLAARYEKETSRG